GGTYLKIFATFFRIGIFTFGGGFSMIPLIKREIVDNSHWMNMEEFMEAIAIGQSAPGAVAVNTATFVGYKVAKYRGAFAAILGVSLPSFLTILAIATFLLRFFNTPLLVAFFKGAAGAVVALLAQVSFVIGKRTLKGKLSFILTGVALVLLLWLRLHPLLVILICGILGFWLGGRTKNSSGYL
ncbi:chromate transporter, partial [Candidatus Aerophobetes bacterium]|nr:chromate transporter [Candidatus Aerophobetes bacterium]